MTMIRSRIASIGGDAVYLDVYWDDPQPVESQGDGTIVEEDPAATRRIHEVYYQNLYQPPHTFTIT